MTSVAVLLSFKSLIIASIIGYASFAQSITAPKVKVVYVNQKPRVGTSWDQQENLVVPNFLKSYIQGTESFVLDDETKVVDHYHTFVD